MAKITCRMFTKSATAAGVATALSVSRVLGAGNRIRLGFIGLGNRGDQMLDAFLEHKDCEVLAICDIYHACLGALGCLGTFWVLGKNPECACAKVSSSLSLSGLAASPG
jgi:hypothetical protein